MSELPPPVGGSQFQDLEGATAEQVKARAAPLVEELHAYLNESSCLSDIQRIRRRLNPAIGSRPAFGGDKPGRVLAEREHWYTYNTGGRNEAQFNIGLFPEYLRVGLGFEFTKKAYGDPEKVQSMFGLFREGLAQRRQAFDQFAQVNVLQVEWLPEGKAGRTALQYVPTHRVSRWLLRPKVADWIFVGRLLGRVDDAEILGDPVRLKDAMESVFAGFKPLWQEAQTEAARYPRG